MKLIAITLITLFLLDQFALFLERKGYLYWRYRKPDHKSGVGSALEEFNRFFNPATKHVVELKQKDSKQKDDLSKDK